MKRPSLVRVIIPVMILLMMFISGAVLADNYFLTPREKGIIEMTKVEELYYAVISDLMLYINIDMENKDAFKKDIVKVSADLAGISGQLDGIAVPPELKEVKAALGNALKIAEASFKNMDSMNEKQMDESFETARDGFKKYSGFIQEAVKKYMNSPVMEKNASVNDDDLALFDSDGDREMYQKAEAFIKNRKFADARKILDPLLIKYKGKSLEGSIYSFIVICDNFIDTDVKKPYEDQEKEIENMGRLLENGGYFPRIYVLYLEWRTLFQSVYHGMSNFSEIPNSEYIEKKYRTIWSIAKYLESNKTDKMAKYLLLNLLDLEQIERGGVAGNYNLNYWGMLFTDVSKKGKNR